MIDYKMRNPWILTFKTIAEDMLEKEAARRRTNRDCSSATNDFDKNLFPQIIYIVECLFKNIFRRWNLHLLPLLFRVCVWSGRSHFNQQLWRWNCTSFACISLCSDACKWKGRDYQIHMPTRSLLRFPVTCTDCLLLHLQVIVKSMGCVILAPLLNEVVKKAKGLDQYQAAITHLTRVGASSSST